MCVRAHARARFLDMAELDMNVLLEWLTNLRTLQRDFSLCPAKDGSTQILFKVQDGLKDFVNHVCTYEVDAPRFESYEEMLEMLKERYRDRAFDRA